MLGFFLRGCRLLFAVSILSSLVVTFINVVIPQVISFAIDSVIDDVPPEGLFARFAALLGGTQWLKERIWVLALVIAGLALIMAVFQYCVTYFNHRANQTLMRGMRNKLFSHIQRLPLGWHSVHQTGDIIQRCTSDADAISNFISNQLTALVRIVILVVLSLTLMFMMDVKLAAIAAAFIPVLLAYSLVFYSKAGKSFKSVTRRRAYSPRSRRKILRACAWCARSAGSAMSATSLKSRTCTIRGFGYILKNTLPCTGLPTTFLPRCSACCSL